MNTISGKDKFDNKYDNKYINYHECHCHIILSGDDYRGNLSMHSEELQKSVINDRLRMYANAGITYMRDGGDRSGAGLYAREIAPEYGITFRCPVFGICRAYHYGRDFSETFKDFHEFKELVKSISEKGGDFIKLFATGIMDFSAFGKVTSHNMEASDLKDMVDYCHQKGFSVMVHASGREGVRNAVLSGADSIEHGYYMDDETLHILHENNSIWVPTLSPVHALIGRGLYQDSILEHILSEHMAQIKKAASTGCLIAPGSDAGAGFVYPQTATSTEYKLLIQSGVCMQDIERGITELKKRF